MLICMMNTLIDLCLIFSVWKIYKTTRHFELAITCWSRDFESVLKLKLEDLYKRTDRPQVTISALVKLKGKLAKTQVKVSIAEKFADRAFNLASSANLGVIALQKALIIPKPLTPELLKGNAKAKSEIDALFAIAQDGEADFMRPLRSDEENDIIDHARELKLKEAQSTLARIKDPSMNKE